MSTTTAKKCPACLNKTVSQWQRPDYRYSCDTCGLQWTGRLTPRAQRQAREDYVQYQSTASDLVLCESADGWSLHAPGSTDEEIATGDAPYLVSGAGRPTEADYARALEVLAERA